MIKSVPYSQVTKRLNKFSKYVSKNFMRVCVNVLVFEYMYNPRLAKNYKRVKKNVNHLCKQARVRLSFLLLLSCFKCFLHRILGIPMIPRPCKYPRRTPSIEKILPENSPQTTLPQRKFLPGESPIQNKSSLRTFPLEEFSAEYSFLEKSPPRESPP